MLKLESSVIYIHQTPAFSFSLAQFLSVLQFLFHMTFAHADPMILNVAFLAVKGDPLFPFHPLEKVVRSNPAFQSP